MTRGRDRTNGADDLTAGKNRQESQPHQRTSPQAAGLEILVCIGDHFVKSFDLPIQLCAHAADEEVSVRRHFSEKDRGTIAVGKYADFVLLSRDIFAPAEKDKIADTKVLLTVVGGKVVFERK